MSKVRIHLWQYIARGCNCRIGLVCFFQWKRLGTLMVHFAQHFCWPTTGVGKVSQEAFLAALEKRSMNLHYLV